MTLVLTVNGPETLWMVADRRLSPKGGLHRDDARKIMLLSCMDGFALLGYAGLGATAKGTEPADWMAAVLRGRRLPLEQSLYVLAGAVRRQVPPHLRGLLRFGSVAHHVMIPAFVEEEARLYSITLGLGPDGKPAHFELVRRTAHIPNCEVVKTPRFGAAGSGGGYLLRHQGTWARPLLRLVRAYDRERISAKAVAAHLATLNYEVAAAIPDRSVGPRCIVVWRPRKGARHRRGGGHACFTGTDRERTTPGLPQISNGMDLMGVVEALWPHSMKAMMSGEEPDLEDLNEELAKLPKGPDEDLS